MHKLPNGWEMKRVDELCRVTRGASPRPINDWIAPTGTPWVKIADATADASKYITKTKEFIRDEGRGKSVVVRPGDLILSNSATPGIPKFLGIEACIHDGWLLLRDLQGIDPMYFYYVFLNDRQVLAGRGNGSIFTNLKTDIVKRHELAVPPIREQQAIANVLSAFDDKIAANVAIAATTSELAGSTYDLSAACFASRPMSDVLTPVLGGTPSRSHSNFWGGDQLWASAKDITGAQFGVVLSTDEMITEAAVVGTKAKPLPAGSVILTARGTVGAVARLAAPASFNQSCYGFVPGAVPPGILYFAITRAVLRAKEIAHGSVFDTITMKTFDHLPFPDFDADALTATEAKIAPLLETVVAVVRENSTLAATRDALLPQLMSGKLRVSYVEKVLENAGI